MNYKKGILQEEMKKQDSDTKIKNIVKLGRIYDRTKNNIIFYMEEGKGHSLLNEIGVLRGIIYAMEEISGKEKNYSDFEKVIFSIQEDLKKLDEDMQKDLNKNTEEELPFN